MSQADQTPWEDLAEKWKDGFDHTNPSILLEYLRTKVHWYKEDQLTDTALWETYQEDFRSIPPEIWSTTQANIRRDLRRVLRCGGVFVAQNVNTGTNQITIGQTLTETATEALRHAWTLEDINITEIQEELAKATTKSNIFEENLDGSYSLSRVYIRRSRGLPLESSVERSFAPSLPPLPHFTPSEIVNTPPLQQAYQRPYQQEPFQQDPSAHNTTPPLQPIYPVQAVPQINWGSAIANIGKLMTNDLRWDGYNSSFDHKLRIFLDTCHRVQLPHTAIMAAFPCMLKGMALTRYYNNNLSAVSFDIACGNLRGFFESSGFKRRNLDTWNGISLGVIISQNPEKTMGEAVRILVETLEGLQQSLDKDFQTARFLHNKLITSCEGIPACRYAISDPPDSLGHLVNKLQSSITAYEKEQPSANTNGAYFTDRRFHGRNPPTQHSVPSTTYPPRATYPSPSTNRCFVCSKENCRSWKHTPEEREQSKAKFRAKTTSRYPRIKAGQYFNEKYDQYVTQIEGDESSDDGLAQGFETLYIEGSQEAGDTVDTAAFLTSFGLIQPDSATSVASDLADRSFSHQITQETPGEPTLPQIDGDTYSVGIGTSRYNSDQFYGIMIDTGASMKSTAGHGQFQALQKMDKELQLDESTSSAVTVHFGIGSTSSIGSALIRTPIGQIRFYIMEAETPFLLSLEDMNQLGVYLNNLKNTLVTKSGDIPVVPRFGHVFLVWHATLATYITESLTQNPCFLTNTELQRLHRRFGHPSVARLQRILNRSGHEADHKALEYLTKFCVHCQRHGRSPGRFRFTLRDDVHFNHSIVVDVMYIHGKPVLHIVDEGTRYQAGRWLSDISAKHTWDALRACWIDTYQGPPDEIVHDAGKNFISKEFRQNATSIGATLKAVPVEAHNSVGIVERYHAPLRRAYEIIVAEIPDLEKGMALQMAFKAINDSVGPNGLVPTLLVYGAFPRMSQTDAPSPSITQRSMAIRKAMADIAKSRAKRQVADALNMRNGPNTTLIHDLPLNSRVLVWREGNTGQSGQWDGPFRMIGMEGESCVIEMPHGNTIFRSTVVKPYKTPSTPTQIDGIELPTETLIEPTNGFEPPAQTLADPPTPARNTPVKRGRGRPRKYPITVYLVEEEDQFAHELTQGAQFKKSRQKEVIGLLERGVFKRVERHEIPSGTRIFRSRFVDEIKNQGTAKAFEKSRLVIQAFNDKEKHIVLTQSPTIQRVSQRIILCIAMMTLLVQTNLYLRDITQAYVQANTELNRLFFIRPPPELILAMGINNDDILQVILPLYGIPEAGNHWFKTYHTHHLEELSMEQSTYDPCLLYSTEPFGVVGLQTDDTLIVADAKFAEQEVAMLKKARFLAKDREMLTTTTPLKFNGGIIELQSDGAITLTQERQTVNLSLVLSDPVSTISNRGVTRVNLGTKDQYVSQRARGAYIASLSQPESSYDLSVAAQTTNPSSDDIKALNKRIQWQIENPTRGLRFIKLDQTSLRLLVFADASFANNKDLSSQIGYVLVLADATGSANIIHWSSIKCKRVTRSVLASELYALAHAFDIGAAVKASLDNILGTLVPLILCTDSKSLYDCLVKLGTTQEKRLMIDVMCLRQAYERREVAEVKWIDGNTNPADSMTKAKPSGALKALMDTNKVELNAVQWVEREGIDNTL